MDLLDDILDGISEVISDSTDTSDFDLDVPIEFDYDAITNESPIAEASGQEEIESAFDNYFLNQSEFNEDLYSNNEDYNDDISFTGKEDKYSDEEYNRKEADKYLEQEEKKRKSGDTKGGDILHNLAMKHVNRIPKK